MDPVDRLLALRAIDDLIGRYCLQFDDQDWDALEELWTEDAAFVVDGVAFEGRDVLVDFLRTCLPEGYQSRHMISPPVVELADDGLSATARTDVVWIAQNFENAIVARYHDALVRDGDRWRIKRRTETALHTRLDHRRCPMMPCASAAPRCAPATVDVHAGQARRPGRHPSDPLAPSG